MAKHLFWIIAFLLSLSVNAHSEAVDEKPARVHCTLKAPQAFNPDRDCASTRPPVVKDDKSANTGGASPAARGNNQK